MVQEAINKKTMNRNSQLDSIYRQTNKLKITLQMEYIIILLCLVYVVWFWKTLYRFNKETKTYEKCKLELWVLAVMVMLSFTPLLNIAMVLTTALISMVKIDNQYDITNHVFLKYESQIDKICDKVGSFFRKKV